MIWMSILCGSRLASHLWKLQRDNSNEVDISALLDISYHWLHSWQSPSDGMGLSLSSRAESWSALLTLSSALCEPAGQSQQVYIFSRFVMYFDKNFELITNQCSYFLYFHKTFVMYNIFISPYLATVYKCNIKLWINLYSTLKCDIKHTFNREIKRFLICSDNNLDFLFLEMNFVSINYIQSFVQFVQFLMSGYISLGIITELNDFGPSSSEWYWPQVHNCLNFLDRSWSDQWTVWKYKYERRRKRKREREIKEDERSAENIEVRTICVTNLVFYVRLYVG